MYKVAFFSALLPKLANDPVNYYHHPPGRRTAAAAPPPPPPTEPQSMVLTHLNPGGLLRNAVHVAATAAELHTDVMAVAETHLTEAISTSASLIDFGVHSWLGAGRPTPLDRRPHASGGVGVGTMTSRFRVKEPQLARTPLGGVAVQVVDKAGQLEPLVVIEAYFPPEGSAYVCNREPLLVWLLNTYDTLAKRHKYIVIATDLNARLGRAGRRHTEDSNATGTAFSKNVYAALRARELSPVHGRTAENVAGFTSRPVTCLDGSGTTEVDYIFARTDALWITPIMPRPWGPAPFGASHRAVSARITLPPKAEHAAPKPKAPPAVRMPLVSDHLAQHRLAADIERGLRSLPAGQRTVSKVNAVLNAATEAHKLPTSRPRRVYTMRRYKNMLLPSWLVDQLQLRREALHHASKAHDRAAAVADVHAVFKGAARAARQVARRRAGIEAAGIERLRGKSQHAMQKELERLLPPDPLAQGRGGCCLDLDSTAKLHAERCREARPTAPPGINDPRARAHVPVAVELPGATGLAAPIQPNEVYWAVFPPRWGAPPSRCDSQTGAVHCTMCDDEQRRWLHGVTTPGAHPPPVTPVVHTSRAHVDIPAETMRFSHPPEGDVERYRASVSSVVAEALSEVMATGKVPDSFAEHVTALLLKNLKSGNIDVYEYDNYRGITVSTYLDKVLDAIITRRLTHWQHRNGIIQHAQVGFMAGKSAEQHVSTLWEVCNARRQCGQETYVLFLDLKKAYDVIHHDTLFELLLHMGVPNALVNLLRAWAKVRTTRLVINGEMSDPIPIQVGVPQGAISSPILFNLFIESLSRYLNSMPAYAGVDLFGTVFRHLLYADDLAAMTASAQQLQVVSDAINEWCTTWGMRANIGRGKTEVMRIAVDPSVKCADDATLPAVVWHGEADEPQIPWVDHYRYLGFALNSALDTYGFSVAQLVTLNSAHERFFRYNIMRPFMSVTLQRQMLLTNVLSTTSYLRGVLPLHAPPPDPTTGKVRADPTAKIDTFIRRAARGILRLPPKAPSLLIYAHLGLAYVAAITAQGRERLIHHAQLSRRSLYSDMLAALALHNKRHRTILNTARDRRAKEERQGSAPCAPANVDHVNSEARRYGIAVGLGIGRRSVRDIAPQPFIARPRPRSRHAVFDALCGLPTSPADAIPADHGLLPISALGAGMRGSLICLANLASNMSTVIVANACGAAAMHMYPWTNRNSDDATAPDEAFTASEEDDEEDGNTAPDVDRYHDRPCPVCLEGNDDPVHAFFECPAAQLQVVRARLELELPVVWGAILEAANRPDAAHGGVAAAAAAGVQLGGLDMSSAESRAILYRLLCGFPFPARVVNRNTAPAAHALAVVFDSLTNPTASLRRMARTVVRWAVGHTRLTAAARLSALRDVGAVKWVRTPRAEGSGTCTQAGAMVTHTTHPPRAFTRWRGHHHDACRMCQGSAGTLIPCARCDVVRHAPYGCKHALSTAPGPGEEWMCGDCVLDAQPLAAMLGLPGPTPVDSSAASSIP